MPTIRPRPICFPKVALMAMPRPQPQYYQEMLACAQDDLGDELLFDRESPCYKKLKSKYKGHKKPPGWSRQTELDTGGAISIGYDSKKSRGLGDTIAKITNKIGIKPCCGCGSRQNTLNRLVPYGEKR